MVGLPPLRYVLPILVGALVLSSSGCADMYPEVVVINHIDEHILVKDPSINGCLWETVLAYDEATSPGHCLPGEDRVHFFKLDPHTYCLTQIESGEGIEGLCPCEAIEEPEEYDLVGPTPLWFAYRTVTVKTLERGDTIVIELTAGDMEQDFETPGPYGH